MQRSFWEGRPIEKFEDDQLGRKGFARFFAEAITRHSGRESIVLSVNAPWGEGKSSFKNMVVDLLAQEHQERVLTLEFIPWEWASQNQVSEAFFSEIAKQLELKDASAAAQEAAGRIRTLGTYLGLASQLVTPAGPFLEGVLPGSTILAYALGKGLTKAREVASSAADRFDAAAEQAKKSLPKVKAELRAALKTYLEQQRKLILVVVDDIDRLSPEEIRLVFQMVRANADFPALVFLLLYDEGFVVKALEPYFRDASGRFLEKIVQFQTNLPTLLENQLRDHVGAELKRVFNTYQAYQGLFDVARFCEAWDGGIGAYIRNLRHCGRLLSSYEFRLGVFRSDEAEVNPLDFLILEVLREFEPTLFHKLHSQSQRLFPPFEESIAWEMEGHRNRNSNAEDPWEKRVAEFASFATTNKDAASRLITILFPRRGYGADHFGLTSEGQTAARERRICHILCFNRYFRLTIDSNDVSDSLITDLVASFDHPARFIASLKSLASHGNLALALTKLLARERRKSAADTEQILAALCDFGDEAAEAIKPDGLVDPLNALCALVEMHIADIKESNLRLTKLSNSIKTSRGVHLAVLIAKEEDSAEHTFSKADDNERAGMGPHLARADVVELNELVAERFESVVRAGSLKPTPAWVRSTDWYLRFMRKRVQQSPTILLASPTAIAVVLLTLVDNQLVDQYRLEWPNEHFAETPMFFAKHAFGFENLDRAINANETGLRKLGDSIAKRIDIYRNMRERFSELADPTHKPPDSGAGESR